jgi:hypothetical protein
MRIDPKRTLYVAFYWLVPLAGVGLFVSGLLIGSGRFEGFFLSLIAFLKGHPPAPHWSAELQSLRSGALAFGLVLIVIGLAVLPKARLILATPLQAGQPALVTPSLPFDRWDAIILAGFALFTVLLSVGSLQGNFPYAHIGGDAANLAGFAAARAHPELFVGDEILGDPNNFRYYSSLTIPLIQALESRLGDYGLAFLVLQAPHVFLHLAGFYLLGRMLFSSRYWAALLAIINGMPVSLMLGEIWGVSTLALPRVSFQTFLPFVLMAAIAWRSKPSRWPVLMVMAGMLMYLHMVSGPTWALALWLGFWAFLPASWSWKKRLAYLGPLGAVFLLVVSPFALNYLRSHASATTGDYERLYAIMVSIYPSKILDAPAAFIESLWVYAKLFLLPLGLLGTALLLMLRRTDRKILGLVGMWISGILVASVGIPSVEGAIERAFHLLPLQIDLVRGIRYLVPFMLLVALWPLAEISSQLRRLGDRRGVALVMLSGALLVSAWAYEHPPYPTELLRGLQCLAQGRLVCTESGQLGRTLDGVREATPPGSRILATALPMQIRYRSTRPVLYTKRDGDILGMANHAGLVEWERRNARMNEILGIPETGPRLAELAAFGRELGADYLFVDFPVSPEDLMTAGAEIAFQNPPCTLLLLR